MSVETIEPHTAPDKSEEKSALSTEQTTPSKQPDVNFKRSETIELGYSNKILRKMAYLSRFISFGFSAWSAQKDRKYLSLASAASQLGVNATTFFIKESNNPLPDTNIVMQSVDSLTKPQKNTLFFQRSWTMVSNLLTFAAGIKGGRKEELIRGAVSLTSGAIDISGLSLYDRRAKKYAQEKTEESSEDSSHQSKLQKKGDFFTKYILENRWVSMGSSTITGGMLISEGINHKRPRQVIAGIFNLVYIACSFADDLIIRQKLEQKRAHAEAPQR